jgi:hypothetical protein
MKPLKAHASLRFPALSLDATDLQDIAVLFTSTCGEVKFSDDSFEYDSLAELLEHAGNKLTRLQIEGRQPFVSLKFNRGDFPTSIFLSAEDDAKGHALFHSVAKLLDQHRRWHVRLLPWPIIIILALGLELLLLGVPEPTPPSKLVAVLLLLTIILGVAGQAGVTLHLSSATRKQHSQRWTELRDKLVLAILSALIGGILGALIHAATSR